MAPEDEPPAKDPTVKDLLSGQGLDEVVDEATRKELERWFGLPSAEAMEIEAPPPPDPELELAKERRAAAIASVDPALLGRIEHRVKQHGNEAVLKFRPNLETHVDPGVAQFDQEMLAKIAVVAEPRDYERPEDLADEMKSVAPQALLRDLHRPVTDFTPALERIDIAAEQRLDIVEEVRVAMATSWKLPPLGEQPSKEARKIIGELRRERGQSWPELFRKLPLPNRRIESDQ